MTASMSTSLPARQPARLPQRGLTVAAAALAIAAGTLAITAAWPRPAGDGIRVQSAPVPRSIDDLKMGAPVPEIKAGMPYGGASGPTVGTAPRTLPYGFSVQPDDLGMVGGPSAIKAPTAPIVVPYGTGVPMPEIRDDGVPRTTTELLGDAASASSVGLPPYGSGLPKSEVRNDGVPRTTTELMGGAPAAHWSDGNVSGDPRR